MRLVQGISGKVPKHLGSCSGEPKRDWEIRLQGQALKASGELRTFLAMQRAWALTPPKSTAYLASRQRAILARYVYVSFWATEHGFASRD